MLLHFCAGYLHAKYLTRSTSFDQDFVLLLVVCLPKGWSGNERLAREIQVDDLIRMRAFEDKLRALKTLAPRQCQAPKFKRDPCKTLVCSSFWLFRPLITIFPDAELDTVYVPMWKKHSSSLSFSAMICAMDSALRPGVPIELFLSLVQICKCALLSSRRSYPSHTCQTGGFFHM